MKQMETLKLNEMNGTHRGPLEEKCLFNVLLFII